MQENLYDRDKNVIGTVEYVNISKETNFEPYRQYLPGYMFEEETVEVNAGGLRITSDKKGTFKGYPENCIVIVDLNGVYFHHRIEYRFQEKRYTCARRTDGPPIIPPDQVVKQTKERAEAIVKARSERFVPKDIDQLIKDWDAMFLEFNNVITRLFNKKGKLVGTLEEGLDTFIQLNLQVARRRYFRAWHYVKEKKVQNPETFEGIENGEISTFLAHDTWFSTLFPDPYAKKTKQQ